jgi:hypothetical protein
MARKPNRTGDQIAGAIKAFMALPPAGKAVVVVMLLIAGAIGLAVWHYGKQASPPPAGEPVPPGTFVFMVWNVENLFDDRDDKRNRIDNPYDDWFAQDASARQLKLDHLAEIILRQNGGNGPDILACVEVESLRAAELLRDALNAKLPAGVTRYEHVVMKELAGNAGRYIAPCVISKLTLDAGNTRLIGKNNLRVLRTSVVANGYSLTLVASHWTSQLKQDDGGTGEEGRDRYAAAIYAEYAAVVKADPEADFLVCGDFNDRPEAAAVQGTLHMTGDRAAVVPGANPPRLFGLLAGKPAGQFGTLYHGEPLIYDQIGVSAGLLDNKGWGCDPDSVRVAIDGMIRDSARTRRPWRFGGPNENPQGRGYADHFPVVVNLTLAGAKP